MPCPEALDQLPPAHLGHHEVREHEVDGPLAGLYNPERVGAVPGLDHRVPLTLEQSTDRAPDRRLVFDQQQRLRPVRQATPVQAQAAGSAAPLISREENREGRALPRRALPAALVVKKGSKIRACVGTSMPIPVSETASVT